jgi:predicted nucleic acid-binding protein
MDRHDLLLEFIDDLIIETGMCVVSIPSSYLPEVVTAILRYRVDFDDAYQLVAAERHSLGLVSFDRHFDATPIGRVEPADVIDPAG